MVTIVGKTWDLHVREDLRIPLDENLDGDPRLGRVPEDARRRGHLRRRALLRRLRRATPSYALACLRAAAEAGADVLCLCDTRGGSLPVARRPRPSTPSAPRSRPPPSASTATTTASWPSPTRWPPSSTAATQVQGTINGFGERCGNANLVLGDPGPPAEARISLRVADAAQAPGRGVALRLRAGEPRAEQAPAVRRPERLRPQGRAARRGGAEERRDLRAHRSRARRQRAAHPRLRPGRALEPARQGAAVRHRPRQQRARPCRRSSRS